MQPANDPVPALPNPLHDLHQQAGAEFQAYAQLEVVSTFGEPQAEYAAIRKGAALVDLPQRGILELTGADRLSFLNNLLTNQTWDKATKAGLPAGQGVYAFFLNTKGRIVADVNVIERGDRTLLDMDARMVEAARGAFDKFLFREQVKMVNQIGTLHTIALHGPGAGKIIEEALGVSLPTESGQLGSVEGRLFDEPATVWRDDVCGVPGFHVVVTTAAARKVWMGLVSQFYENHEPGHRRLRPAGWAAFNATRIEAGRPLFGIDFDDSVLPAETGQLARAVSFTKGCYLGQEIVARMHARGQVARQLVGLRMADDALPMAGTLIYDDKDNQVGGVTSSTVSPVLSNACIAIGFVKKPFVPAGSVLNVPAEGAVRKATVVELPFVRVNAE
ncbi:MAG TPA: glycine cleavage T C-terminal barrel domain-containing protein [Tepidisphaeraceae bacterium]|jgi:aminomethyltransferase|nr:glycine cleavage T C-terminal barrel domain-containing protein [Tepidisphaeraceae bacterium]